MGYLFEPFYFLSLEPFYFLHGLHAIGHKQSHTCCHDDVIKWKHFPHYWPFVRGIHRSPVNSPHKDQWRGALMFSLICVWSNGWVNNCYAGDLRRHRAHYDIIVITTNYICMVLCEGTLQTISNGKYTTYGIFLPCENVPHKMLNTRNRTHCQSLWPMSWQNNLA